MYGPRSQNVQFVITPNRLFQIKKKKKTKRLIKHYFISLVNKKN